MEGRQLWPMPGGGRHGGSYWQQEPDHLSQPCEQPYQHGAIWPRSLVFSRLSRVLTWMPSNAAPEWQAGSMGWRRRELVVACPLEGLVSTWS